jgi:hypothetical protein
MNRVYTISCQLFTLPGLLTLARVTGVCMCMTIYEIVTMRLRQAMLAKNVTSSVTSDRNRISIISEIEQKPEVKSCLLAQQINAPDKPVIIALGRLIQANQ